MKNIDYIASSIDSIFQFFSKYRNVFCDALFSFIEEDLDTLMLLFKAFATVAHVRNHNRKILDFIFKLDGFKLVEMTAIDSICCEVYSRDSFLVLNDQIMQKS